MDDDTAFHSISGVPQETSEPLDTSIEQTTPRPPLLKPARDSSTSLSRTAKKPPQARGPTASATNSPQPSRESSPVRPSLKTNASRSTTGPGRSRKNSTQDVSPARSTSGIPNLPSAAATQRVLSAASIPPLHPVASDPTLKAPVPQKLALASEVRETPRWPISPRLRSPPPINKSSVLSPRKIDHDIPSINAPRAIQSTEEGRTAVDSDADELLSVTGMRTPARGVSGTSSTLETVQEISQPNTPGSGLDGFLEKVESNVPKPVIDQDILTENGSRVMWSKPSLIANESGSESGGRGEIKLRATSAAPQTTAPRSNGPPTKSFSTGGAGRGKPSGEGSTRNMTVETETVSSIPQVAVGTGASGNNGSIRTKPSSETIRPKKEKKKTARKAPSVTSGTGERPNSSKFRCQHHHHFTQNEVTDGLATHSKKTSSQGLFLPSNSSSATSPKRLSIQASRRLSLNIQAVGVMLTQIRTASSKADIFEAKVASAVDEANSSDSEETFVYESNPPDASDRPRRFHSRTPSATSMASQVDQRNGVRAVMDGHHSVAMKKSMKFANSYNSTGPDSTTGDDDGKGTARSNIGTGRGTTHHHHIGGRWGRNGGNGHPSLFDNESPFPNAAKSKLSSNFRQSPRPTSPRIPNMRMTGNGKRPSPIPSAYDLDDGADDERTPLISTVRSSRSGRARRPAGSMRQLEHQASRHSRSMLARFTGCLVFSLMIILVVSGAIGFIGATTQPLTNVKVLALKNVLASEQDVIFDMKVQALNRNLVVITVDSTDLVVFAKSKYAGTDSEYWKRPQFTRSNRRGLRILDDDPIDPPLDDDPEISPNFEIGHVFAFDSPLTFEGSPFHTEPASSSGQIRITHPGNKTIPMGSERWGRVLQHEFELIVRGTLKYTLPLSQKLKKVSVVGRVTVKPNAADHDPDDAIHINL